jgi:glycosyltransferase involved in cell wall biosynthesis
LLSDYESQGVVGLEALAVGCPLLVADGTALAELGVYGDVSIVPPHVDGQALGWLIAQQIQQELAPATQRVPMWEHTVDELSVVYADVLRRRGSSSHALR